MAEARPVPFPGDRHPEDSSGGDPIEDPDAVVFPFRFVPAYRLPAFPFGIRPATARVTIVGPVLDARFGPWRVTTPLTNVAGTAVTGPYRWYRTAGSARYSLADQGLTFATNGDRGLCIGFHEPVTGLDPTRLLRHPSLTVTVDDVVGLARVLEEQAITPTARVA